MFAEPLACLKQCVGWLQTQSLKCSTAQPKFRSMLRGRCSLCCISRVGQSD